MIKLYAKDTELLIGFFDNIKEVNKYLGWSQLYDINNTYMKFV